MNKGFALFPCSRYINNAQPQGLQKHVPLMSVAADAAAFAVTAAPLWDLIRYKETQASEKQPWWDPEQQEL